MGLKADHLAPPDEKYVAKPADELYLDVGLTSRAEAHTAGIRIGDPITYAPAFTRLANGRISSKSLDDRLAVAALLLMLEQFAEAPPAKGLLVGFSVQEEFNVRGSLALAARWQPTIAVQVDVAPACDTPDLKDRGSSASAAAPF